MTVFLFVHAYYFDILFKGAVAVHGWFVSTHPQNSFCSSSWFWYFLSKGAFVLRGRFFSLDSDLKKLAQEVLELIKSLVGRETFSRAYASLQQTATEARETRKRKKALEVSRYVPVCPGRVNIPLFKRIEGNKQSWYFTSCFETEAHWSFCVQDKIFCSSSTLLWSIFRGSFSNDAVGSQVKNFLCWLRICCTMRRAQANDNVDCNSVYLYKHHQKEHCQPVSGRPWVRFPSGTQNFSLSHARVM